MVDSNVVAEAPAVADPASRWLHVTAPRATDLARLAALGLPASLLAHVTDPDERPRVRRIGSVLLIVLHAPFQQSDDGSAPWVTLPIFLFLTPDRIITISPQQAPFLDPPNAVETTAVPTTDRTRFILDILMALAGEFLDALERIEEDVAALEQQLSQSLRNVEVLELLRYQKSLVWFTTGLRSDELVLERLHKGHLLQWPPEDEELVEDVLIEIRQAIGKVDIAESMLAQMMDAFVSIVSNNLNGVMKVLTAATILLAIPTVVASLWGMNVDLPFAREGWAFGALVTGCLALIGVVGTWLARRSWL
jgi:magnesium transporter